MICTRGLVVIALVNIIACSLGDLVNSDLPSDVRDPNALKTPEGAMASYTGALVALADVMGKNYVIESGLLTDELQPGKKGVGNGGGAFPDIGNGAIDNRTAHDRLYEGAGGQSYAQLQKVRGHAREAVSALRTYHPTAPEALVGHLLAIEGMADVLLGELYCSGIPLSLIEFEGDYTIKPGSNTEDVYRQALVLFDSALVLTSDSTRLLRFVKLARARAFLGLHELDSAAAAIRDVPTGYIYLLTYASSVEWRVNGFHTVSGGWGLSMVDREGINGLPYITSADPRTISDSLADAYNNRVPRKYLPTGSTDPGNNPGTAPIVLASGIEARLIEAEAALAAERADWLDILNRLRTSCVTVDVCPTPSPAGTGGIAGLPPLSDPGLDPLPPGKTVRDVRIDRIFTERAYWLFLTGHRQGDLRRLVTQYRRAADTVYPIGPWGEYQQTYYGTDINLPVPIKEQETNPLYGGCVSRD